MSSSEYSAARSSSLKFKGDDSVKKKKKKSHKREHDGEHGSSAVASRMEMRHDIWWRVTTPELLTGAVIVDTCLGAYCVAVDDGTLTVGPPVDLEDPAAEGPGPAEVFTMIRVNDTRVAFKTGYGRFLSVEPMSGEVRARVEAIGVHELWEPFQHEGTKGFAFRGSNKKYLTAEDGKPLHANSERMADNTRFEVWSSGEHPNKKKKKSGDQDVVGSLDSVETSFVKKFQSFQDGKLKINEQDRRDLKRAKVEGTLREAMLDRRSKMKADRYCK